MSISLDRGEAGSTARRRSRDGKESSWTVLGASRGEAGILGEGIRQALLRDATYRPALDAAWAMLRRSSCGEARDRPIPRARLPTCS